MRLIDADALKAYIEDYACIPCKKYGADRDGVRCQFCNIHFCLDGIDRHNAQRTGKWVKLYTGNYKCSECGDWWSVDDNEMVEGFIYCPNCGARMETENDIVEN